MYDPNCYYCTLCHLLKDWFSSQESFANNAVLFVFYMMFLLCLRQHNQRYNQIMHRVYSSLRQCYTLTHTRTHARTHPPTHARTHAHTPNRTKANQIKICKVALRLWKQQKVGASAGKVRCESDGCRLQMECFGCLLRLSTLKPLSAKSKV